MPFDPDDLAVFLDESEDNLTRLENGLLLLARGDAADVAALFRAAHTLKGSSAMMGLARLTRVTHALEAALEPLRSGVLTSLPDALLRGCLAAVDYVRSALRVLREGGTPEEDETAVLAALQEAGPGEGGGARGALPLRVRFAADTFHAVRAYQVVRDLREAGLLVRSDPDLEAIEQERVGDSLTVWVPRSGQERALELVRRVPDVTEVLAEQADPGGEEAHEAEPAHGAQPGPEPAGGPGRVATVFVRVDLALMDRLMDLTGELVISRGRLNAILDRLGTGAEGREIRGVSEAIGQITSQIQEIVLRTRMTPLERTFSRFPRLVADTAAQLGKRVRFSMEGMDTELDRSLIDLVVDPLTHALRNAVDHGIESPAERVRAGKSEEGRLVLRAGRGESSVVIEVEDDGRGIDPQAVAAAAVRRGLISAEQAAAMPPEQLRMLIFEPGFSTREQATEISGRGVGMDVVRLNVQRAGGTVELESEVGRGTVLRLILPFTMATARVLLVEVAGHVLALPLAAVERVLPWSSVRFSSLDGGREVGTVGEDTFPVFRAARLYGSTEEGRAVVVLRSRDRRAGVAVRRLVREEEVVVKPIERLVGKTGIFSGAAILGNGAIALILDADGVLRDALTGARKEGLHAGLGARGR